MRKTATGGIILTTGSWVQIVCLVLLILFSAFFSASETALTSLNKIRLKNCTLTRILAQKLNRMMKKGLSLKIM